MLRYALLVVALDDGKSEIEKRTADKITAAKKAAKSEQMFKRERPKRSKSLIKGKQCQLERGTLQKNFA